jgi:hypothetical protein
MHNTKISGGCKTSAALVCWAMSYAVFFVLYQDDLSALAFSHLLGA